ncbi:hypothetical protein CWO91_05240 [Bradyrhizobium genosp. SA-3]|uniref:DUF1127 domain-containing protein n=1 Tax=Bradyrhizobium genosp. SA-3 TaxID=508868 RepID=UPI00102A95A4|nr:DUF1127 domain-containing protein [Bradyrhizobium genosp. SA-3]RZN12108.1 hypothetical protein CWO91_05240 [Bradyrhizobium genosp. SA-3]
MSTTYTAAGSAQAPAPTRRPPNFLARYFDAFCAWRIRRSLRETLDELSDLELRDMGVTRAEIDYLVRTDFSTDPRVSSSK